MGIGKCKHHFNCFSLVLNAMEQKAVDLCEQVSYLFLKDEPGCTTMYCTPFKTKTVVITFQDCVLVYLSI